LASPLTRQKSVPVGDDDGLSGRQHRWHGNNDTFRDRQHALVASQAEPRYGSDNG
jgi:hypothetical protein